MSEPLRIALVAEGPTDRIVIESAPRAFLSGRPFVLKQLQPEGSLVFGNRGSGWTGVYRWCKQAAMRGGGRLREDALLFQNYHILLLHIDADVAGMRYADNSILPQQSDGALPCQQPCPPAISTTDALRTVLLSWCGETTVPMKTVICMPSKNTEAWVVAALFPTDLAMRQGIECNADPEARLGQQPIDVRIQKKQRDYHEKATSLQKAWPQFATQGMVREAFRFQLEFLSVLETV